MSEEKGYAVLHDAALNKSTAFDSAERDSLGLRGLLPYRRFSMAQQEKRVLENLRRKAYDIERYIFLVGLMERNERLFYRTVINNIDEIMPLIYTPTVGLACKEFAHIFRKPQGFYITPEDRGHIREILDNWPSNDVRIIVVTDGQRILGLGDLGANGMGIPIGKLSLYIACAGIQPHQCLPVMLDVGTNNTELIEDPLYLGYPHPRVKGDDYYALVDEFVEAIKDKYPRALLQFEDFLTPNAYALLSRYRDSVLCFNDDIQGTAAVAVAGIYSSCRVTGVNFKDLRIMFLGAGSAATGIGDLLVTALESEGLSNEEARSRLWFNDQKGLLVAQRQDLMEHNLPYAHDHDRLDFIEAIHSIKPHVLIGATGAPGTFTKQVIRAMAAENERPVIFALSNPTSKAECSAYQAYDWSDGRALFASGSPFETVELNGRFFNPAQGNNAYVFPGVGLGAIACEASGISDAMFLAAARALANAVSSEDLDSGALYPPLKSIRDVSLVIAVAVVEQAFHEGMANVAAPENIESFVSGLMYSPDY